VGRPLAQLSVRVRTLRREPRPSPDSMTLAGHLVELRRRLLVAVGAVAAMSVIAFVFYPQMLHFLQRPYCEAFPRHCGLFITDPLGGLSLRFKMAMFGGLILASPIVLWELWRFITPGLKPTEKRYAIPFIVTSIVLFLAGCALAYFTYEHALVFLKQIGGPSLVTIYDPNKYLNLILLLMIGFGLTFEFPVILVSLQLARVVTSEQLLRHWRWAIFAITVVAAFFTPTGDPVTIVSLMAVLWFFYFASILIGKLFRR